MSATRRALTKAALVELVDPRVVWERDGGICQLCHQSVEGTWHLDHVIPLSRGGEHSYKNVQVAHPLCNLKKGSTVLVTVTDAVSFTGVFETSRTRAIV